LTVFHSTFNKNWLYHIYRATTTCTKTTDPTTANTFVCWGLTCLVFWVTRT